MLYILHFVELGNSDHLVHVPDDVQLIGKYYYEFSMAAFHKKCKLYAGNLILMNKLDGEQ